jgi:hypothetical protein
MRFVIVQLLLLLLFSASARAEETWSSYLYRAQNILAHEDEKNPSFSLAVIALRKAWNAAPKQDSKEAQEKIRTELANCYRTHGYDRIAKWYAEASVEQIDQKLASLKADGQTRYSKDWRVRADEFGLITIWRPETMKARQKADVYHFKPGDAQYADILTAASVAKNSEKAVDFDLSEFGIADGPSSPFAIAEKDI